MNLFKKSVAMLIAISVSLAPLHIHAKNVMEMEQILTREEFNIGYIDDNIDELITKNSIHNILLQDNKIVVEQDPFEGVEWSTGYTECSVNVRKKPSTNSDVLDVYTFNNAVEYYSYDDKWNVIKYGEDGIAFMAKDYISDCQVKSKVRDDVPRNHIKSYMGYHMITATSSPQYRLQHTLAYTGNYGIRQVNGRYCVALGSAYITKIGTYFDLILENGTVIPCILADQKDDKDTDSSNKITEHDMSLTEFVVSEWSLSSSVTRMGDISYAASSWNSPVKYIKIYDYVEEF